MIVMASAALVAALGMAAAGMEAYPKSEIKGEKWFYGATASLCLALTLGKFAI